MEKYLQPTFFLDYTAQSVETFSTQNCDPTVNPKEKAIQLYYSVRDLIRYDPYDLQPQRSALKASTVVEKGSGYCVAKAVLLTALARKNDIPARLGFADVTNHLSTPRLKKIMKSNLFIYHGYTEFFLENKWVKATPAFNLSLCKKFHVKPLEFDGINDSLFHEFDARGLRHMEYVRDHGSFADLPFDRIFSAYEKQYPGMLEEFGNHLDADFHEEAQEGFTR